MIQCLCIDDSNRPKEIPESKWVKKDNLYTIIKVTIHPLQDNIQGCELAEISLDETCLPYEYYRLSRFAIQEEDVDALKELIKLSAELDDVDVDELIKKSEIEIK